MRLMEKYGSIEQAARENRQRYSGKAEHYCYLREERAKGEWLTGSKENTYYLFWINMHYLFGLMRTGGRA